MRATVVEQAAGSVGHDRATARHIVRTLDESSAMICGGARLHTVQARARNKSSRSSVQATPMHARVRACVRSMGMYALEDGRQTRVPNLQARREAGRNRLRCSSGQRCSAHGSRRTPDGNETQRRQSAGRTGRSGMLQRSLKARQRLVRSGYARTGGWQAARRPHQTGRPAYQIRSIISHHITSQHITSGSGSGSGSDDVVAPA